MSAPAGTVRISREFFDDAAFKAEPLSEREAFLWMIMEASFKTRERRIGRETVKLERGEFAASIRFMQKAWRWASTRRVHAFICALQKRNMIGTRAGTDCTIITLCNYDKYQSAGTPAKHGAERETERSRNAAGTNENKDAIREEREAKASLGRKRPSRPIPPDAVLSEADWSKAEAKGLSRAEAEAQFVRFRDSAIASGRTYADWGKAWVNWLGSPYFRPLTTIVPLKPESASVRQPSRLDAFLSGARSAG